MREEKNIKAKNFRLQLYPKDKLLKIGFGEYFYQRKNSILISEEFVQEKLKKINDLQVNDKKRNSEFNAIFKNADTHFLIKEVYRGTLDIMNFIKTYNENPFQINPKYTNEVAIVIDSGGYYISLRTTQKNYKSIYLFSNKNGYFFQIYNPKPIRRYTMKSCELNHNELFVIHDGFDLYTNEQTKESEYRWSFDIQPELLDLMVCFIHIGLNADVPKKKVMKDNV
jgi:hypothetical protein